MIQAFGGLERYERRLRPHTNYGLYSFNDKFFASHPAQSVRQAPDDVQMGVVWMPNDEWKARPPTHPASVAQHRSTYSARSGLFGLLDLSPHAPTFTPASAHTSRHGTPPTWYRTSAK